MCAHVLTYPQCRIIYCYTYRLLYAGAAQGELPKGQERVLWRMTVPRNSFTRYYRQFLRISFINQLYRRVRRPRRTACHPSAPCIPVGAVIDRPHNAKSLPNSYLLTPTSYLAYALHSQLSTLHSTAHKKNPKLSFRVLLSYSSSNAPV